MCALPRRWRAAGCSAWGMMLQERVDYDARGQPQYNSTWDYKIPSAACIPREFNIALLEVRS